MPKNIDVTLLFMDHQNEILGDDRDRYAIQNSYGESIRRCWMMSVCGELAKRDADDDVQIEYER